MRMAKVLYLSVAVLSLSHCATKHQPMSVEPYFPTGIENRFGPEQIAEARAIEAKPELTALDKKRLSDLYTAEAKQLKPGHPRHQTLSEAIKRLKPEVVELEKDLRQIQADLRQRVAEPSAEKTAAQAVQKLTFRKDYSEAQKLWNGEQGPLALKKIDDMLKGPLLNVGKAERLKFMNLKFRILLEAADMPAASQTYAEMKVIDPCDADIAQAGFLLSLRAFGSGDATVAMSIFKEQCDPDKSAANEIRRKYWMARYSEGDPKSSNAYYEEVMATPVPGYHGFMAHMRLGKKIELPRQPEKHLYLTQEFDTSSEVHHLLVEAEERLAAGLRRDASWYLQKAARRLKKEDSPNAIPSILYTAHLFHATGHHLESMKLYAHATTLFLDNPKEADVDLMPRYTDMFPRPFAGRVESLAKMWSVDPDFVYSIVRQESAFNPGAVSVADARGLMQLMPTLARSLSRQWNFQSYFVERALFDADENLKLGVFYLHQLQELVPHIVLVAASYNAGVNRAINWWRRYGNYPIDVFIELIPITETRNYVKLVLRNFFYYKALRTGVPVDPEVVPFQLRRLPPEYANATKY